MPDRRIQIAEAIRQRIFGGLHLGKLKPGARLPSTRDMAGELDVAPKTVMSAYRLLAAEGLVELRERSGIYLAPGGASGFMLPQLAGWLVDVLVEARSREIAPIDFPERVRLCLETLRLRAVCIAGSADQVEEICHELLTDYGIESQGLDPDAELMARDGETQLAVRQADLLVGTSAHATQLQYAARLFGKAAITVTLRPEFMGEIARQLASGPVYIIASDPRFRDVAHSVFAPVPGGRNLRPLILGEDDLGSLPPDAPIHIMRRAHRLLRDDALAQRLAPLRRVFSNDVARQLLSFVVRSNITAMGNRSM